MATLIQQPSSNLNIELQKLEEYNQFPPVDKVPKVVALLKDCQRVGINTEAAWLAVKEQSLLYSKHILSLLTPTPLPDQLWQLLTPNEVYQPFHDLLKELQDLKRNQGEMKEQIQKNHEILQNVQETMQQILNSVQSQGHKE